MAVARASLGELLDWLDQRGGRCALNGRKVGVITRGSRCLNFKNRRKNAPVRYCSMCGEVVNKNIAAKQCSEEGHAKQRRSQNRIVWIVANNSFREDDHRAARGTGRH